MSPPPRCPVCGSNDLWGDDTWEGCNRCKWISNGEVYLAAHPQHEEQPEEEEPERLQLVPRHFYID